MTTLSELMTWATAGTAELRAEDGQTLQVDALLAARLWTQAVDDTVRFGYLGRDLRDAEVVLEDGGGDIVRVSRSLRYVVDSHSPDVAVGDALERLCTAPHCDLSVVSTAVDTCEDHLDHPMHVVALLLQDGALTRPEGCTDDEAAIRQLSRERRVHAWTEDIARRELETTGERRVIASRMPTPAA
jgi:hypothetical protein